MKRIPENRAHRRVNLLVDSSRGNILRLQWFVKLTKCPTKRGHAIGLDGLGLRITSVETAAGDNVADA